ncbi:hypothetical protein ASPCAL14636 [Aspergillus calidoustus]|uniref:Transcription factor domain-containing protein n=1 Tax=Aspergillus calidoustus TaxID=454130 RepID=A0A0U5GNG2_ASPCI|nr:hypothetical protein ASPCAL14636 [Aspergillus calidoustus]
MTESLNMLPPENKASPPKFQFVGGAVLKGRTDGIRSSMIRRAVIESRAKRRRDAEHEIKSILRQSKSSVCACHVYIPVVRVINASRTPVSGDATSSSGPIPHPTVAATTTVMPSAQCQSCGGRISSRTIRPPPWGLQTFQAGNLDPLVLFDTNLVGIDVQRILNVAGAHIWPSMRPLDYSSNCYRSWVFPFEDKLKVYIVLWSTCYYRDMLRITHGPPGQEIDSKQQLYLRALVIRRLREEVDNIESVATPDGLVMTILFLAVNVAHRTGLGRDASPFSPPFTGLHTLDIYGSRKYHPIHWDIMHNIIRRFGGVSSLKVFAIAWHVSIADLMHAANTLQKPIYPALGVHGQVLDLVPPLALFHIPGLDLPTARIPGLGFQVLACLSPPIRQDVIHVFAEVGQYSCVIQHYGTHPCGAAVLDLLGDSRNLVHHRLFSLPSEKDDLNQVLGSCGDVLEQTWHTWQVYLLVRLSAILYAIHVSFPIPRSTQLRERVVAALSPMFPAFIERPAIYPLLLWSLVIVVIASGDSAPRQLLDHVAELCGRLK